MSIITLVKLGLSNLLFAKISFIVEFKIFVLLKLEELLSPKISVRTYTSPSCFKMFSLMSLISSKRVIFH